jgi:hypothetical protein
MKDISEMPADLRRYFGGYGPQFHDGYCGEPIAWGYMVIARMGEERWTNASEYGQLECIHGTGDWCLVTKVLTPDGARTQYGEVTGLELGPRGGFRSVTYGSKKFGSKRLDPTK